MQRARPDLHPLAGFSGPSFPSGHATAAAATFIAIALVVGRDWSPRGRRNLAGAAVGVAVAVACSRVFLGVHWVSDVIGGLILGWTWGSGLRDRLRRSGYAIRLARKGGLAAPRIRA